MKFKVILVVFCLLASPSLISKNLYEQCEALKKSIERRPQYDIGWRQYKVKNTHTVPSFKINGFDIPVLSGVEGEVTALGQGSEITFKSLRDNGISLIQGINIENRYSTHLEESGEYPLLVGRTIFDALKQSYSISSKDISCNDYKALPELEFQYKEKAIKNLLLVLLKANFTLSLSKDVLLVKERDAFLVRTTFGFEYYEKKGDTTISVYAFTKDPLDIDRFINSLVNPVQPESGFEIAEEVLIGLKRKKPAQWLKVIDMMKDQGYSSLSIEAIEEQLEYTK